MNLPTSPSIDTIDRSRVVPGRARGATVGVLAYGLALGVAELVAGVLTDAGSPLLAVGDQAIDLAPEGPRKFAIDTFGTADKPALVWGIVAVTLVLGAVLGTIGRRPGRRVVPTVGLLAFGVVGAAATLAATDTSPVVALAPSALGAAAGVVALRLLFGLATGPRVAEGSAGAAATGGASRTPTSGDATGRRHFLLGAGATAAVAVAAVAAGRALASRASAAASRAAVVLRRPTDPLPPIPAATSVGVDGVTPFVTPNGDFYRIDTNLIAPQVQAETYELRVHGLVDRERTYTYADLLERSVHEYDITLSCVSNEVGGRLAGNARWQGFPLRDLLDEAGVAEGAEQIIGRAVDGWTCGFPVEAAYDRNAIVAVAMNGEPLPIEHGFPVRLVTPGIYGFLSACKWLTEVELGTFEFEPYWVRRTWGKRAPIRTFSRIDVPKGLQRVAAGTVAVGGVAWAQTRGISKVEVQVDDGPWNEATLGEELNRDTWRQWKFAWDATPGNHRVRVRATDGTGETQIEEREPPIPTGATGWHAIQVSVGA